MAVTRIHDYLYIGLAADVKPTGEYKNSRFITADTGEQFVWTGAAWVELEPPALGSVTVAAGDIQIGAVELKNATTDDRAVVEAADADGESGAAFGLRTSSFGYLWNGTTWDRAPGNVRGGFVQGPTAHDSPVTLATAQPLLIGGRARTSEPSATADGDAVLAYIDETGHLRVKLGAGSAAIGSVSVTSSPATNRTSDSITAYPSGDYVIENVSGTLTERAITHTVVAASSAGDNTLVAAQGAGVKIRVLGLTLVCSGGANTVRIESGAGGTAMTGQMTFADDQGFVWAPSAIGYGKTAANALLNLELASATAVAGLVIWCPWAG